MLGKNVQGTNFLLLFNLERLIIYHGRLLQDFMTNLYRKYVCGFSIILLLHSVVFYLVLFGFLQVFVVFWMVVNEIQFVVKWHFQQNARQGGLGRAVDSSTALG